jgi:hypothetical protein
MRPAAGSEALTKLVLGMTETVQPSTGSSSREPSPAPPPPPPPIMCLPPGSSITGPQACVGRCCR